MAPLALRDREWARIAPLLPDKPRGLARTNDRRVLNGIFSILRTGPALARPSQALRSIYDRFQPMGQDGATRYDKLAKGFLAAVTIAAARLWCGIISPLPGQDRLGPDTSPALFSLAEL
ncbi:transposase [Paracoccus ferrooxidans]|nr:transposase [Paracoccus ferrooxidans]